MASSAQPSKLARAVPYLLVIGGIIGIICSLVLTYDQLRILQNPAYHPACSLNPVLSCGSVINSKQGHILGIPGPMYGLLAFPVVVVFGVIVLSGAKLKRWLWLGLEAGAVAGLGYALWLFWISLYKVHALCPFCLTVDTVVYTLLWYITLYNIEQKHILLPAALQRPADFARRHHLDILILWFLLIAAFILHHFWYFYGKYF